MLTAIYRTYPLDNKKPRPFLGTKLDLIKLCFNSFLKAFEDVDLDLVVLLDKTNDEHREIFNNPRVTSKEESYYSGTVPSIVNSLNRGIDIALEKKNKFIMVEDDHYFLPGAGKIIEEALDSLEFLTAYDHPAHYNEEQFNYKRDVKLVGGHHWITVMSTTHSFAGQYEALKEEVDVIKSYGFRDHECWLDVTQRHKLWCPIPSLSTHVESGQLAPCVDWSSHLKT